MGRDGEVPAHCLAAAVVGSSLFSYIQGDGVRCVYEAMHARVLETGRSLEFPYRCDSPWFRREMWMKIGREGDALRYDSLIVRETRRARPLPQPSPDARVFVVMCSFCKQYRFPVESPMWKDLESLPLEPDLLESFSVTHGICETCAISWLSEGARG